MEKITNEIDHDLIVSLNTKFDYMARDIKILSDGMSQTNAAFEIRIRALEKVHEEYKPEEAMKKINFTYDSVIDLKRNIKTLVIGSNIIVALMTWIIANWVFVSKLFTH